MSIINVTTARNDFLKLVDEVIATHEPTFITSEKGDVVVLSEEGYRAIQETLYLTSIPGLREKIIDGLNTNLEDCVKDSDG